MDKYEKECPACDGTGRNEDCARDCRMCDGSGIVLNDEGEELLAFLEKYLTLQVKGR